MSNKKGKIQRLLDRHVYLSPHYNRAYDWFKLLGVTGLAQVGVQAIGFVAGILILRLLPTQEYAFYTLGNTLLGTMVLLTDGGLNAGVMTFGGKVWKDKEKLGEVLVTGYDLRKKFAIVTLIVGIPVLFYLLRDNDASWLMTVLIVLSLIPAYLVYLSYDLLEIGLKLKQDIIPLQRNQVEVNLGRLFLLCLVIFIFPFAFVALLAATVPQVWGNFKLRKLNSAYVDWEQKPSPVVRRGILKMVKRIMPESIYYAVSGQITIWLLSFFGSTSSIAEIGALSRIAMVLTLITVMCNTLIVPRFARLRERFGILIRRFLQMEVLLVVIFLLVMVVTWLIPSQILWILGPKYAGLQTELILTVLGNCIGFFGAITFTLYSNRGWVINPVYTIGFNIVFLALCIYFLDVTTLKGVLILNIAVSSANAIIHFFYGLHRIYRLKGIVETDSTEEY